MRIKRRKQSAGSDRVGAELLAKAFARAAEEKLAKDIVVLDLRGRSPVTDFFVIATAANPRQQHAVVEALSEKAADLGHELYGAEGLNESPWALLDYVDVVAHVFGKDGRRLYDLELLWGDAPRVAWRPGSPERPKD